MSTPAAHCHPLGQLHGKHCDHEKMWWTHAAAAAVVGGCWKLQLLTPSVAFQHQHQHRHHSSHNPL